MKAWVTTRRIKAGREEEFRRRWASDELPKGMSAAYLLQEDDDPQETLSIGIFEDAADLQAWRSSDEARQRRERLADLLEGLEMSRSYEAHDITSARGSSRKRAMMPLLPVALGTAGAGAVLVATRRRRQQENTVVERGRRNPLLLAPLVAAPVAGGAFFLVRKLRARNEETEVSQTWQGETTGRAATTSRDGATQTGRAAMRVRELMTASPETVDYGADLATAAAKMRDLNVGVLPVMADGRLAGIITDRDIALALAAGAAEAAARRVGDVMTEAPVTVAPDASVEEASQLMARHQVRRLPVVEGTRLVGILALGDLASEGQEQAASRALEEISEPAQPQR